MKKYIPGKGWIDDPDASPNLSKPKGDEPEPKKAEHPGWCDCDICKGRRHSIRFPPWFHNW